MRRAAAAGALLALLGTLAVAATAITALAASGPADVILTGGRVFTSDPDRPWAEAVAVRGDRISAVGTSREVEKLAGPKTRRIDLAGRLVVAGFNDAHAHIGPRASAVRLKLPEPEPTFTDVLTELRKAAFSNPTDTRFFASVGSAVFDDPRAARFILDEAARGRFVWLTSFTGHGVLASSTALRALGIPEEPVDPAGGWFERVAGSNRASGVIREYAQYALGRRLTQAEGPDAAAQAWRDTAATAVRFGVTTIQNMSNTLPVSVAVSAAIAAEVPIRVRQIRFPMTDTKGRRPDDDRPDGRVSKAARVAASGIKWILDGTPIERGAAMREPYADRPGERGRLNFSEAEIRKILEEAKASGEPLMLHCAGDETAAAVLRQMEATGGESVWGKRRVRIEHGDGLMEDLWPHARRLGVVVVQNPAHFTFPDVFVKRLGPERAARYQPVKSLAAAGIPLAIGSDGPLNPFLNLLWATTDPNHPAEALSREQAVVAYTRGSAYAEFAENEKGTLRPGYLADLAVLSQDVFTIDAAKLPETESVLTMVGGRVVYEKK
jgi:predicted amidohydrolase YtcJ